MSTGWNRALVFLHVPKWLPRSAQHRDKLQGLLGPLTVQTLSASSRCWAARAVRVGPQRALLTERRLNGRSH
jgi:hypothetical protein